MGEMLELGAAGRAVLGERARKRIIDEFSLDAVVRRYEELYEAVCAEAERGKKHRRAQPNARFTAK
jgi:hypothetical protein